MTQPDLLSRPDFAAFYERYPRKKAPGRAEKAYDKAIKLIPPEALQEAVTALRALWDDHIKGMGTKERNAAKVFCPHPATWLNDKSWNDEEIQEYLARPKPEDLPKQIKIYPGTPEGDAWMKYEIEHVNQFAKSHWIAAQFMYRPTPFPPEKGEVSHETITH